MKKTIEGIEPKNRDYFKEELKKISTMFHVNYEGMNAKIEYDEPYIMSNEALEIKGNHVKQFKQFINEFRTYQFNQ